MPPPSGSTYHSCDCLCPPQPLAPNKPAPPGTETCSFSPGILSDSYLMEGGTENLTLPASKAHIPREGLRGLAGRTLGVGWSISASWDPEWVGKK